MPRKSISISHFNYSSKSQFHLSENAELAAIFGLALFNRKKKGFLRSVDEKLKYVSLLKYPLYIYPRNKKALMLNPMLNIGNILNFGLTDDVHKFIGELQRTSVNRKIYTDFLADNLDLFEKTRKDNQISLDGLMMNNDLSLFIINEAKKEKISNKISPENIIFSIKEEKANLILDRFENILRKVQMDSHNLKLISNILDVELVKHISKSDFEINIVEEQADEKIEEYTPSIKRNIRKITKEKNSLIRQFENNSKKKSSNLFRVRKKLENELRRRKQQEARFKREKQNKKNKQDKYGEKFWSKELSKCKKEIARLETRFKRCEADIGDIEEQSSNQIDKIKNLYSEKISFERKKIVEIEYHRDNIIRNLHSNQRKIEEFTDKITNDITKQLKLKKLEIEKLSNHLISWNIDDKIIITIPFYLIQYASTKEMRYGIIPPLQVNNEKNTLSTVGRKLVGLDDNLSDNLKPFSKDLSEMVTRNILTRLSKDTKLSSMVDKEALNTNLLTKAGISGMISEGLEELAGKELLSRNDTLEIKGYGF